MRPCGFPDALEEYVVQREKKHEIDNFRTIGEI